MISVTSTQDCLIERNDEHVYLAWDEIVWDKIGSVSEYEEDLTAMCKDHDGMTTVFLPTHYNSMTQCSQTCLKLEESFNPFPETTEQYENFQSKIRNFAFGAGPGMGIFLSAHSNNGEWTNFYTGEPVDISHLDIQVQYNCMLINTLSLVSFPCDFDKGNFEMVATL